MVSYHQNPNSEMYQVLEGEVAYAVRILYENYFAIAYSL